MQVARRCTAAHTLPSAGGQDLYVWDGFNDADTNGNMVYFPRKFSDTPRMDGAITKAELPPYLIVLAENLDNVPARGRGQIHNLGSLEYHEFEAGDVPNGYMDEIASNKHHSHEIGFTPEMAIVDAMRRLDESNTVTDDRNANFLLGSYLVPGRFIPHLRWMADDNCAVLGATPTHAKDSHFGARVAVAL